MGFTFFFPGVKAELNTFTFVIARVSAKESISRLKEKTIYLIVNVLSTQVLIGDTIFTFPVRDGTAFLRDHPTHAKL